MMDEKQGSSNSFIRMYDVANQYKIIDKVGRGTYGTVFKAKNLKNGKSYAIKKLENNDVKLSNQGFPITALREISLLKVMNHENIIKLKQIILSKPSARNLYRGSTFLVFQYMDHDLAGLFKNKVKFTLSEIKCIAKQLLKGVAYLHENKILHRDIKSANILINDQGQVKLGDFGLGRKIRMEGVYTCKVVTLWYRAPQLLLGYKLYDGKVDVWSIGCVLAEFIIGQVLFKKDIQYSQIERIYEICGDLKENKISQDLIKQYTYYNDMKPKKSYKKNLAQHIKKIAPDTTQDTISFLQGLLDINPFSRLTCEEALNHPFFFTKPLPCKPSHLQKMQYQCHEMFRERNMKIQRFSSYEKSVSESKNHQHHKNHHHKKTYHDHGYTSRYSQEKNEKYSKNYKDERHVPRKQYIKESNYKDRYSRDRDRSYYKEREFNRDSSRKEREFNRDSSRKERQFNRDSSRKKSKQRRSSSPRHKNRQISTKKQQYDKYSKEDDQRQYRRSKQYRYQKERPYQQKERKYEKHEHYNENKHKYGRYEDQRNYRDDKQFEHGEIIEKRYKHYQKSIDYEPRKKEFRQSKEHRQKKQYSKEKNYRQQKQYRKHYDSREKSPYYKRRSRSKSKKRSPVKKHRRSSSYEKSNYSQRDRSRQRHSRSYRPHDRDRKPYRRQ